jgi:beta-phosphoglucomutase-like phosphatase (HAD superfamily)
MQGIELVIFDRDGTLVDSERLAVQVDSRLITELGWPLAKPADSEDISRERCAGEPQMLRRILC